MKGKIKTTLLITVLLISTITIAVNALPKDYLINAVDGVAIWSDVYANTGSWSVKLTSGDASEDASRVYVPISPIPFQDLTSDPSYMVYETTVTLDTTWGGEWPVVTDVPWGHPYINIVLDLDGNLDTTDDIDRMEGVGSTAGEVTAAVAIPPTVDTWTEMYEGWGYYDDEDSIIGGGWSLDISGGPTKVHTLAEWKTEMAKVANHPDAKVVGIQVTYGFWKEIYMNLANAHPVYVDDIKVNGVTYSLEPIVLDSEYYAIGDVVSVTVVDAYENDDAIRTDKITVTATSDTDVVGISVTLTETGVNTGIFEGSFLLVPAVPEPDIDELGVTEGDEISAAYGGLTYTATIDDVAPEFMTVEADEEYYKNGNTITLTATLDEDGYTVTADFSAIDSECTADVTATGTYTIEYTIDEDNTRDDGEYTITVTAEDEAGNTATSDFTTNLDNTMPSVTDAVADPSVIQPATPGDVTVIFTASVFDELSGVASVTIDLLDISGSATQQMYDDGTTGGDIENGDGVYTCTWSGKVALEGDYVLPITATDTVGNENDLEAITLHVIDDTEGPSDISFTEVEPICGGLIVKGLTADDPLSGVLEYEIYVDEVDLIRTITVDQLISTDWTSVGSYKGTFVLDLPTYVGETVEVTVVAIDYAANPSDPVTLYSGVVPDGTWIPIMLYNGWNLVSLPLIPDSSDSGDILSLILDQGASGVVVSYEYDQYTDTWITNPTEMTDGYGYWLYMLDDDVMIVEGIETLPAPALPQTYEFTAGWVLAGYKQTSATNDPAGVIDGYLASLEGASYFKTIYVWRADVAVWDTLLTSSTAEDDVLYPGMGFWIWMYSDQNLIAPLE